MFPFLIDTSFFTLHSYGFIIIVGSLIGIYFMGKNAKAVDVSLKRCADLSFWTMLIGLLGARILYVITLWGYYSEHFIEAFYFWRGGFVWYGALIFGTVTFFSYIKKYNLPLIDLFDLSSGPLSLAQMFGRIGCFAVGCCWGKQCDPDFSLGVVFKHQHTLAPKNIPIHPTQLYDAFYLGLLALFLQWAWTKRQFKGQTFSLYLIIYPILRSVVEEYRGDKIRGFVASTGLSTSQFISLFIFSLGVFLYFYCKNKYPLEKKPT